MKFTLSVLIIFFIVKFSPQKPTLIEKGDNEYNQGKYLSALQYYEKALKKQEQTNNNLKLKIANCYYYLNNYTMALQYFSQVSEENLTLQDIINYAQLLQNSERYEEANILYEIALAKGADSTKLKTLQKSILWAEDNLEKSARYDVIKIDLPIGGQSFGLQYYKNSLVYSTALERFELERDIQDIRGYDFTDICYSPLEGEKINEPHLFAEELIFPYHEGAVSFTPDYDTIFFTSVDIIGENTKKPKAVLKIYQAYYDGIKWVNVKELPFNSNEYSCAHLSISADGNRLFFASNMPGGFGGNDLWMVHKKDTTWGTIINLGNEVNTPKNEVFPFISKKGVLYFSSDGQVGYGGLDVFYAVYKQGKWTKVTNLRQPINSSKDDFAYIINPENDKQGFLSSNRIGDGKIDYIYAVTKYILPPDTIKGILKNKLTEKSLTNATVFIINPETKDTIYITKTNAKGEYELLLAKLDEGEETYSALQIEITPPTADQSYAPIPLDVTADEFNTDKSIKKEVNMNLLPKITPGEHIMIFNNIYFKLGSAELREEDNVVLDRIVAIMKDEPTVTIKLSAHTDCQGDDKSNLELSEKRAQTAKTYIVSKGILPNRIVCKGYGEQYLLNQCDDGVPCSEEEHAINRRVEIKFLKQ